MTKVKIYAVSCLQLRTILASVELFCFYFLVWFWYKENHTYKEKKKDKGPKVKEQATKEKPERNDADAPAYTLQEFSACAGLGPESRDCLTLEKGRMDDERGCKREAQVVSEITEAVRREVTKNHLPGS